MKRTPLKRKSKTPRAKAIARADAAWAAVCKARAGWKCEYEDCGKQIHLHAHHVRSRRYQRLRWDLANGTCLCFYHHLQTAHRDPLTFASWFRTFRFSDYTIIMRPEAIEPQKLSVPEIEDIARELNRQLEDWPAQEAA